MKIQSKLYEYFSHSFADLVVVADESEAKLAADALSLHGLRTYRFPDFRASYGDDLRSFREELHRLITQLHGFYHDSGKKVAIVPFKTLSFELPKPQYLQSFGMEFAQSFEREELKERFYNWGYDFVDIVEQAGEVSFRGDIVDIFPPGAAKAYRLSFFDDELESIRTFELQSQKSDPEELESITVLPAFLSLEATQRKEIEKRVEQSGFDLFIKDMDSLGFWYLQGYSHNLLQHYGAVKTNFDEALHEHYDFTDTQVDKTAFDLPDLPEAKEYRDLEVVDINAMLEFNKHKKITLIAASETTLRRSNVKDIEKYEHVFSDAIVNIASEKKMFLSLNKKVKQKPKKRSSIILDELNVNDYVVHEDYGIGRFKAVEKRSILGAVREFIVLEYQNKDQLLLPVESLNLIDRYIAEGGALPILDKLGKNSFKRIKEKVKTKLFAIANQIIKNAAQRLLKKGNVLETEELELFRQSAGFEYTPDQKRACDEIAKELASGKIMDRLLSGDVGFGKTEVAMNAIFIAAKSGYQSAMVVPTTLLANQHYKTIRERLKAHGITVAKVDRFVTAKNKTLIKQQLQNGEIDLLIGTHALFGMEFAKLSLVIIDEEHKFGVKQKEKLKELAADTHLLSMSATPIPRSLNMALSKVKTFSELFTPPSERKGVRTFVKNHDEKLVKEIIMRELRRGGQLFYIFNSIAGIEEKKQQLHELLPELRILVLHSKVPPAKTEREMLRFESGEYDLLLSTTVVESGIHIPTVNTIIVDGADNFGIADLHQLRGRVGRGDKEGFAYFLVQDKEVLTEQSKKRLLALESHSDLGSGAILAMHDLEIRGGGNIIGEAQSGNIKQIGYGLYLKMLEDTIRAINNETQPSKEVEVKLSVTAYLNEDLISEDRLRLELYRRLSHCESVAEIFDIEEEIRDRFGKPDNYTRQFLDLMIVKLLAKEKKIVKLTNYEQNITLEDERGQKSYLKSPSKDDDDILKTVLEHLRS